MQEQQFDGKSVPWTHLEEYLNAHQKHIATMLDYFKVGVINKADIESKLLP